MTDEKIKNSRELEFAVFCIENVAEKLGVEPVFTVINWDNKVFELNGKGIDVVWNGMTITTAAQESMECTNAYCNNAQVIVTK